MHKEELEKAYFEQLVATPQGRWLLRNLVTRSGCLTSPARDFSSKDTFYAGRRSIVLEEVVQPLSKHMGYKALDIIMEEYRAN